jgi:hypothetical protein
MLAATVKWRAIALKWRDLAKRRANHHVELFQSGRWKHYYTDEMFLLEMRAAILLAQRWSKICAVTEPQAALPELDAIVRDVIIRKVA